MRDLSVTYRDLRRVRCPPYAGSTWSSTPARSSGSPASPGAASPRWPAPCCGCSPRTRRSRAVEVLVGARRADDELGRPAGAALGGGLDRLPGRAALAQPGAPGRRPDRRADPSCTSRRSATTQVDAAGRRAARAGRPAGRAGPRLPAPALRRAEAAGDDRDGAGLPAPADRGRRADHGARRDGAGAGPRRCSPGWCASSASGC